MFVLTLTPLSKGSDMTASYSLLVLGEPGIFGELVTLGSGPVRTNMIMG